MKNALFIGQITKSPKLLTVLLLISVCCLGGFLLKNAIGVGFDVDYDPVGFGNVDGYRDFYSAEDNTDVNGSASISVSGSRYEDGDDGLDPVSWVYIGGSASVDENRILTVSAWASAGIAYERSNDLAGKANAWIKFPHEGRIGHDPVNPGAADVGKGHDKIMVEVSDSRTYNLNEPQQWGRVQASASMRAPGGQIKFRFGASPNPLPPPDFSSGDIIDLGEFPMEIENHTKTPSEQ